MSLTSSLSFAAAGLDLNARRADVVARNVANADRAGYARRELGVTGGGIGQPGSDVAISRGTDPKLVQLRRAAQSGEAANAVGAGFFTRLDEQIGDPDGQGSLQGGLARLDAAFVSAAASPSSPERLAEIAHAADGIATKLNGLDATVQAARQDADVEIGRTVERLNSDLRAIAEINTGIVRLNSSGHDTADLLDRRAALLDGISQNIPVRELPRDDGTIALVTQGGVLLVEGSAATLEHSVRNPITPEMSAPAQLSGLSVNGRPVDVLGERSGVPGGRLQALFDLRDRIAPETTARLDGLASELIGRFEGTRVDPTLAPGEPGLFTDAGSALDPAAAPGVAGRLAVNAIVSPDRAEEHWRLRDGLAATARDASAPPDLLLAYGAEVSNVARPLATGLPDLEADMIGHAANLKSSVSADRIRSMDAADVDARNARSFEQTRDGGAVDLDAEMRRLVEIEQAYAANARVVRVVDDMMNRLMEI